MNVITRFAPSPTGMLHIGGARTALFNYLFAKHHQGKFLLRVEDTDAARSSDAATQAILDGMGWMGLQHDGEVVYQSQNKAAHAEIAQQLVQQDKAYYCYATPDELAQMRADAEAKGVGFRYDRRWRDADKTGKTPPEGASPCIRIKAPLNSAITVHDKVQGEITFSPDALDDFVILRADGSPTYMLAVVVDDHHMGITHIIRGDDHFNNAARQSILYQAMGWDIPVFAHIPLIHGADGAKLSKRHGATAVGEYSQMGFLPEAMRNYLLRLGWSHGDDEIISDAQAIEWFDLDHIGKSPSRFDTDKLRHINAHYLRLKSNADLAHYAADMLGLKQVDQHWLARAIGTIKERLNTLNDLQDALNFYLNAPQNYDQKAQKMLRKNGENLSIIIQSLTALNNWQADHIKTAIHDSAQAADKKLGQVMPPIRAAIVGNMQGPDMAEAMAVLGREASLARLQTAYHSLATKAA
jgi:glutamyl-tRNA synthetase